MIITNNFRTPTLAKPRDTEGTLPEPVVTPSGGLMTRVVSMSVKRALDVDGEVFEKLQKPPATGDYTIIPRPAPAQLSQLEKGPRYHVSFTGDHYYDVYVPSDKEAIYRQGNPNPKWERFFQVPLR